METHDKLVISGAEKTGIEGTLNNVDWDAKLRGFLVFGLFMTAAAGLLLLLLLLVMHLSGNAASFRTFQVVFVSIVLEAVPFILLGSLISGLIHVIVPEDTLRRLFPAGRFAGVMAGALLGLLFPICECGVIPVARGLMRKGVPFYAAIAFILAAPVVNPVVMLSTAVAFNYDLKVVAIRVGFVLLIAVAIGLLMSLLVKEKDVLLDEGRQREGCGCCEGHGATFIGKTGEIINHATQEFFDVGRFLILGSFLAAFVQSFVSRPQLLSVAKGALSSVISMNVLAVITCLCSEVDAFVARSFALSFPMGAVLSFMIIGPMLDLKSILMLLGTFKRRPALLLIILIAALTMAAGLVLSTFRW